ncbi:hypothetical protein KSS87_002259 [Heliosperma pusillum]|nr:hypothetical protein KSS87_002259 [Heliosperma pusillum]
METKQAATVKIEGLMCDSKYKYLTQNPSLLLPSSSSSTTSAVGFMELLGMQDMIDDDDDDDDSKELDVINKDEGFPNTTAALDPTPLSSNVNPESSQLTNTSIINNPATPNSSSISSASNDDQEEDQPQQPAKKQRRNGKKTNEKRQREARVAFMTKSEVDHLEDGYRWRKYGQKAVKNSPFPRSYYRCTSASCNVKKRVERLLSDPSVVVTTYQGQHTHPCTILPRGMMPLAGVGAATSAAYMLPAMQMANNNNSISLLQHLHQMNNNNVNSSMVHQLNQFGNIMWSPNSGTTCPMLSAQQRLNATHPLSTDNGLLEDIVPSFFNNQHYC